MRLLIDIEANGLKPDKIFCIVCRDIDHPERVFVFEEHNLSEFASFVSKAETIIGHNFLGYDRPAILACLGIDLNPDKIIDTLVLSKTLNFGIEGGHSLGAWAARIKIPRTQNFFVDTNDFLCYDSLKAVTEESVKSYNRDSFILSSNSFITLLIKDYKEVEDSKKIGIEDFSKYSLEVLRRCVSDTLLNVYVFKHLEKYLNNEAFKKAFDIEHKMAVYCRKLHDNGFAVNEEGISKLNEELVTRLVTLDKELVEAFPPRSILVNTIVPRETKNGTIFAADFRRLVAAGIRGEDILAGVEYPIYELQEFNPGSNIQVIDRLWEAGWKPTDKTKGHILALKRGSGASKEARERFSRYGWTLSEDNLKTLPETAPVAVKKLVERRIIASRIATLKQWVTWGDSRVHGNFNHIGSWPHRMSHSDPNMANIPKAKPKENPSSLDLLTDKINDRMREMWVAPPGKLLVGVDADGIQMRIFAHYVNDKQLIDALIKGDKKNGTDIHSLHKRALGAYCKSRDAAKTFIYAWLLGAGVGKVSEILECSAAQAEESIDNFIGFYPSLRELKKTQIPADARRGFFVGLDDRYVICDDAHLILAGYLQNGESTIMKYATQLWNTRLQDLKIPYTFVNFVHDEWQTEVDDDLELANKIADIQMDSIREAGELLHVRCPLAGTKTIGHNWRETH